MARNILVTGGTSGIGAAIADAFASEGDHVVAAGLECDIGEPAPHRPGIQLQPLDVRDDQSVRQLVASLSGLDVLVNCAGIIHREGEHQPESFVDVVDVNLLGTMRISYACHDLLAASGGCVLNTASMLTFFGSGPAPAYSASKGGVGQLTRSLAIAWADDGIRVNAIAPGWIETQLTRPLREDPEKNAAILNRTPLRRWGSGEDVCGAALFLCSDAARFITGVILPVDGGYSCA